MFLLPQVGFHWEALTPGGGHFRQRLTKKGVCQAGVGSPKSVTFLSQSPRFQKKLPHVTLTTPTCKSNVSLLNCFFLFFCFVFNLFLFLGKARQVFLLMSLFVYVLIIWKDKGHHKSFHLWKFHQASFSPKVGKTVKWSGKEKQLIKKWQALSNARCCLLIKKKKKKNI